MKLQDNIYSDSVFGPFLLEYGEDICQAEGDIRYVDGKVEFGLHGEVIVDSDDQGDGEVPFL